jgi:hypothetical protein
VSTKAFLLCILAVALLILAFGLYRFRSSIEPQVDPHAAEEIEKAKSR